MEYLLPTTTCCEQMSNQWHFTAPKQYNIYYFSSKTCIMVCPSFWEDYYMLIYTHSWELMNSVGSHGGSSLPFVMKVMVCHFVSDSEEVMTALIVVLPLIVVVEISLQLHQSYFSSKTCSVIHWWGCFKLTILNVKMLLES